MNDLEEESKINTKNNTIDDASRAKSVLFLLVFVLVVLASISYFKDNFLDDYFGESKVEGESLNGGAFLESYDPIKNVNEDSDGDGVVNWREVAGGTDPDKKDTQISGVGNGDSQVAITSKSNLTSLVASDLFVASKYKEKYRDMNIDSMSASVAKNYEALIYPKKFVDLKVIDNNEASFIKSYGNGMGIMFSIILNNRDLVELKELKEDTGFIQTQKYLTNLDLVCDTAKKVENIPLSYFNLHQDFVFNCELYSNIINGIIGNKEDEVRASMSLGKYDEMMKNIFNNFNAYVDKLSNDNAVYKNTEYGYIFINKLN